MSKRFLPIMFHVPGKPGIYAMEEVVEIEKDTRKKPLMVEPCLIKGNTCEHLGRMEFGIAIEKFK